MGLEGTPEKPRDDLQSSQIDAWIVIQKQKTKGKRNKVAVSNTKSSQTEKSEKTTLPMSSMAVPTQFLTNIDFSMREIVKAMKEKNDRYLALYERHVAVLEAKEKREAEEGEERRQRWIQEDRASRDRRFPAHVDSSRNLPNLSQRRDVGYEGQDRDRSQRDGSRDRMPSSRGWERGRERSRAANQEQDNPSSSRGAARDRSRSVTRRGVTY